MAMTEINDQLLEQFFQPAKAVKVEDNGFTERVMRKVPYNAVCLSHLWTLFCVLLGIVAFVVFVGWQPIFRGILMLLNTNIGELHPVPFFMTAGVLISLAVVELVQKMERLQI
jgi:hypothetical protein